MFTRLKNFLSKLFVDTTEVAAMTKYVSQATDPCDLERRLQQWERNRAIKANLYKL